MGKNGFRHAWMVLVKGDAVLMKLEKKKGDGDTCDNVSVGSKVKKEDV